jgi:hypothetical protein
MKSMTTYRININEDLPQGKALVTLLKNMECVEVHKEKISKKLESPYNPEFVKKIKRAMQQEGRIIDPNNIWESIK